MLCENKMITIEQATPADCPVLAFMNRQLIDDGGDDSTMADPQLESRMYHWLQGDTYTGFVFKLNGETIGYALIDVSERWLRHFFICRIYRRRGYGREAVRLLMKHLGLEEIGLSCLTKNVSGQGFWRSFQHEAYSTNFSVQRPDIAQLRDEAE